MGYQPRTRAPKKTAREYRKAFQEKSKKIVKQSRHVARQFGEEKTVLPQQQVFEITLKRLHTLGNQKFGSSPFSEHFDRWLRTVETVLDEFKIQSDIKVDEQFTKECKQILETIKLQFETYRQQEISLEIQINSLSGTKKCLEQVNKEYQVKSLVLREQKTAMLRQLSKELEVLKEEQNQIVKLKTGFFRGISKKEREQRENFAVQKYIDKQQEFEVKTIEFKEKQKQFREEFECKREFLLEDLKSLKRYTKEIEEDYSLEERWFTCESLKDVLNNFLQRKKE
ncbi:MAG: hypothetical protein FWB84_06190 [Candidatus Bathyarchaeota archaeon]|uniref:hypothetical protein n=1 Tax=Candidatus Bathycorpusculum sp. TaxID=2994959 RepID=UPI00282D8694|nr:hypothetical protein [Candidatus Termiticorpusculum sp.]MCL2258019.1 hypothetical protein [Candidatus Termiticorpusculum sp.]MCL2291768.1 hypothetical protein [Candidatus Termiticorpusculum sp.]